MAEDQVGIDFLAEFFRSVSGGYLVDVGAHDGVDVGSMTRALLERGWGGLMIEPLPEAFKRLEEAYRNWPAVMCLQLACSDENKEAELYPCKGVSTLEPAWRDACEGWWDHVHYGPPIKVFKRRLVGVLGECGAPGKIDLLQIDTEGHDLQVLRGMDWDRSPTVVCVEILDMLAPDRKDAQGVWLPSPEIDDFMKAQGYRLQLTTRGGNGFYLRGESA